jgi:multiple sugar transport system substrate-binding protein
MKARIFCGPIAALLGACLLGAACSATGPALTFSGSALGAEGNVIRQQLDQFAGLHPGIRIEIRVTPDAADQRHQLYVQWLNARASEPDVLQLDVIWTAEFAAAGWILAVDRLVDEDDFFPAALEASRWQGRPFAVPWFVDVGLLYWRTDLLPTPPGSLTEMRAAALDVIRAGRLDQGLVWQGARYEGLVTVFLEHLTAFGGRVFDEGGEVVVDRPEAVRALTFMRDSVRVDGLVPVSALSWQEEHTRFAFQSGNAVFMRNWPYAWMLLNRADESAVAGRVGVMPFPAADGGHESAALGGSQLAINRYTEEADLARALVAFLTAPEQMLERARVAGQLPARRSLFQQRELAESLSIPLSSVFRALEAAVARPVTPVYSELSDSLQVHLHRTLSGQEQPDEALREAAREIRALLDRTGLSHAAKGSALDISAEPHGGPSSQWAN